MNIFCISDIYSNTHHLNSLDKHISHNDKASIIDVTDKKN